MSRYYRTAVGDDSSVTAPAIKPETKPTPEGMPRARKHSRPPQPAFTTAPNGDTTASTPTNAPPPPPVRAMPIKRPLASKDRDKHLALLKEEIGLSKSNRRLLLIGGAALGLGALVLLFSGGDERGRGR